jgi:uncharacterized protein DUF4253
LDCGSPLPLSELGAHAQSLRRAYKQLAKIKTPALTAAWKGMLGQPTSNQAKLAFSLSDITRLCCTQKAMSKDKDMFALLVEAETNGDNYDISTEDIIARLKKWQEICSFRIFYAEHDTVDLAFDSLPKDTEAFIREAVEFCPDLVMDDPETEIPHLIEMLKKSKILRLWWD